MQNELLQQKFNSLRIASKRKLFSRPIFMPSLFPLRQDERVRQRVANEFTRRRFRISFLEARGGRQGGVTVSGG